MSKNPPRPALAVAHENGVVHIRCTVESYSGAGMALTKSGVSWVPDLYESSGQSPFVSDIRIEPGGRGHRVVEVGQALRAHNLTGHTYASFYDPFTPGPMVRLGRVGPALNAHRLDKVLYVIDYGPGGVWYLGHQHHLGLALAIAEDVHEGLVYPVHGSSPGDLHSFGTESVSAKTNTICALLRAEGIFIHSDDFVVDS